MQTGLDQPPADGTAGCDKRNFPSRSEHPKRNGAEKDEKNGEIGSKQPCSARLVPEFPWRDFGRLGSAEFRRERGGCTAGSHNSFELDGHWKLPLLFVVPLKFLFFEVVFQLQTTGPFTDPICAAGQPEYYADGKNSACSVKCYIHK